MKKLTEPRHLTIGHTFTKDGVRVEVVRDWRLAKALYRHATWTKKKQIAANNAALLETVSAEGGATS